MSDPKNIPGRPSTPHDEEILNYLNKNMPEAAQHDFEKTTSEDEFMQDAMEGLESLQANNVPVLTKQINADLKRHLQQRKSRKEKRKYKDQPWIYFAVILIILLILAAFFVVSRFE